MSKKIGLIPKITITIILLISFLLSLNTFLNFFNFQTTYSELVRSRFEVIAKDLKNTIEYNINLGLSLSEAKNLQDVINDILKLDKDIAFIKIFNARGGILFDTDSTGINTQVSEDWVAALHAAGQNELSFSDPSGKNIVIGIPIQDNFNTMAGAFALGYAASVQNNAISDMFGYLLKFLVTVLVCFSMLTFFFVHILSRGFTRHLDDITGFLDTLCRDESLGSLGNPVTPPGYIFSTELGRFKDTTCQALWEIRETEKRIKAIGKGPGGTHEN